MNHSNLGCLPPRATDRALLRRLFKLGPVVVAALALSACGGGGGDGGGAAPGGGGGTGGGGAGGGTTTTIEGAFVGSIDGAPPSTTLILLSLENNENREYWAWYGKMENEVFAVYGFLQGTSTGTTTTIVSYDVRDFRVSTAGVPTVGHGALYATYVPGATISGSATIDGVTATFDGQRYLDLAIYNYNTPAQISEIIGKWTLESIWGGDTFPIEIADDGTFRGSSVEGCEYYGSFVPRPSGKNVFDVTVTIGPAPCAYPGASYHGIALTSIPVPDTRQLVIGLINPARTEGDTLFGTRPVGGM